jgi:methionyl-tRNA synthetase
MNLEGQKISGSRNWAVWGLDFLGRFDPDSLRYYLTVNMPENKDSDWDWRDFVARNNNELVATWGNLANRALAFCHRTWDGHVPSIDVSRLRASDLDLLSYIEGAFDSIGREYEAVHLRSALQEAMRLASLVNQYLDQTAPWTTFKHNREEAALSIYTAMRAIDSLKTLFSPILPFSSQRLHELLGYQTRLFGDQYVQIVNDALGEHAVLRYRPVEFGTSSGAKSTAPSSWSASRLEPGRRLNQPSPLFRKLEESVAEEERARLGK